MDRETALWAWFLFASGLSPQRAKTLLTAWGEQGLSLQVALAQLPDRAHDLGVTAAEAARLTPPPLLSDVAALRWDSPLYPKGLLALPLKLRPALLFFEGDPALLSRQWVYLAPGQLRSSVDQEWLQEVIGVLLGEDLLLVVYEGSAQHMFLFDEMLSSEGEALLFAREGLAARSSDSVEVMLRDSGRLVVMSPLSPSTPARPTWEAVLQRVALAAAERIVLTGVPEEWPGILSSLRGKPALLLSNSVADAEVPATIWRSQLPSDVLGWIAGQTPFSMVGEEAPLASSAGLLNATDSVSSLSAAEILDLLGKGGTVPEVLRKRLLGDSLEG